MVFRVNRPVPPPSLIPLPPTPFPLRLVIAGWLGAFEVDNFVGELVEELGVVEERVDTVERDLGCVGGLVGGRGRRIVAHTLDDRRNEGEHHVQLVAHDVEDYRGSMQRM